MVEPRERFVQALRGLSCNGMPLAAAEDTLKDWSLHLSRCGFIHVDEVPAEARAGLPKQEIFFKSPVAGPDITINPGVRFVERLTDGLSDKEKQRMAAELREEGIL